MAQDFRSRGSGQGGRSGSGHRDDSRNATHDRNRSDTPTIELADIRFGDKPSPELFADIAEKKAEGVSKVSNDQNKSSQLRRFYDELVMWQEKVGTSDERFGDSEPYIRMMKAKVAYAKGRRHVDSNFQALFCHIIDQITSAATLRQGKLFLEAFMAFYKVHRPS